MSDFDDLPLFNRKMHDANREDGIHRSEVHAESTWKAQAKAAILVVCAKLSEFTSDDVWEVMDEFGIERPHTPSALGPVFRHVASEGWIHNTGRVVESRQITNHRKVTVWRADR